MYKPIPEPDPQHVMLEALNEACDTAAEACISAGHSEYDVQSCWPQFNEETGHRGYQSVVFTGEDLEGYDYEEAMDMVMAVGARDLDIKINEARGVLRNLNALLCPEREPGEGED